MVGRWGIALITYAVWVAPPLSPYNRLTSLERQYGVKYLRDVFQVDAKYFVIQDLFGWMNYLDAFVLLTTTIGFMRKKSWAPSLTCFWSVLTISLAVVSLYIHFSFIAVPEAETTP